MSLDKDLETLKSKIKTMVETANPEINVEDLMLRIREEVALCKAQVSIAEVA